MIPWLALQVLLHNFCLGAMLPIVPALSPDSAGLAFSAFSVFKILYLLVAGRISDRIGHDRALALTLVLQTIAFVLIASVPSALWLGRIIEGMALGQGSVSSVSLLRAIVKDAESFKRLAGRLMGAGGLGFILGPIFAYTLLRYGATVPLVALAAISGTFLVAQAMTIVRREPVRTAPVVKSGDSGGEAQDTSERSIIPLMVGLAAAKILGVGWQPNIAWWATHTMHLSPMAAGVSFIAMGLSFTGGAALQRRAFRWTSLPLAGLGLISLELALRGWLLGWWIGVPMLGGWFGAYVTQAVSNLGWNRPESIGAQNSLWMMLSDAPMAFAPLIAWEWRGADAVLMRSVAEAIIALVAGIGLWSGTRAIRVRAFATRSDV